MNDAPTLNSRLQSFAATIAKTIEAAVAAQAQAPTLLVAGEAAAPLAFAPAPELIDVLKQLDVLAGEVKQLQADVGNAAGLGAVVIRVDEAQELTPTQQAQALQNLGVTAESLFIDEDLAEAFKSALTSPHLIAAASPPVAAAEPEATT